MKKVSGENMVRRYDLRDQQEEQTSTETPALNTLAQAQIGRRLGASLWSPEEDLPPAFEEALQKIRKTLS